jgi:hypothetical protein
MINRGGLSPSVGGRCVGKVEFEGMEWLESCYIAAGEVALDENGSREFEVLQYEGSG